MSKKQKKVQHNAQNIDLRFGDIAKRRLTTGQPLRQVWHGVLEECFINGAKYREKVSRREIKFQSLKNPLRIPEKIDIIRIKDRRLAILNGNKEVEHMSNALLRLRESSHNFSSTEKEIARIILDNPQLVVDLSVHALAKHTFSSASTIVRLCNHIGYSGYKEFRWAVTYELAQREQNRKIEQKEIDRSDSLEEIIEKITYLNIISLEETSSLMDVDMLRQCVELIKKARVVYLFGMGASLVAAKDAYLKFLRLNKLCVINEDWHSQLVQARNATAEDVAIVISYSGATVEAIECMKALREKKTPIIAITRFGQSADSDLADYKLYTAANESVFRSGAMSSRLSQLNIIDILYTALANDSYEETLDQLSRTHIHKPGNSIG